MVLQVIDNKRIDALEGDIDPRGDVLAVLFGSKARAVTVRFFLLDPRRAYYQRQVEAATGLPIRAVQRELERLSEIGLLYRRTEGNRTYYQVDSQYPLFADLRLLVLKTSPPVQRLRGILAGEEDVRQAFWNEQSGDVLVVTVSGRRPTCSVPDGFRLESVSVEDFLQQVQRKDSELKRFLEDGVDLFGRRDDVLWARIEAAGYHVRKCEGIA